MIDEPDDEVQLAAIASRLRDHAMPRFNDDL